MPSRPSLLFPLLPALLLAAACSTDDAEVAGGSGLDAPDRILDWAPEEVYAVGGFDAPEWATFGGVDQLGFDGEGNLYILDQQTASVTVVSPEGDFLRTIGTRGEGPGEIGNASGMAVFPDGRVAISDLGKRGIVVYDARGEWLGNVAVDLAEEGLPAGDMTVHPSGMILSAQAMRIRMQGEGDVNVTMGEPDSRPVRLYGIDEGVEGYEVVGAWNPPPPPEGDESTLEGGDGGNRIMIRMSRLQAFEPGLHTAVLPDGRVAVVDSTAYRIELYTAEGEPAGVLERPVPPTPVTERIQDRERERRMAEAAEASGGRVTVIGPGGGGGGFDQAQMRRMMEDRVANMAFFPEVPVVEEMKADWEGRLWVQRSSGMPGEPGVTDLVTPDGTYLGSLPADGLRIPQAFGPDGLVAVRELDDYDVATVRVLRVPTGG